MQNFNIIIVGVGGQGLITLISIINEAAFIEGYDIKSSELHGLSQREGSVETHVKFGKKVYSPLVYNGQANLIIGLEMLEAQRALQKAGKKTKILVNKYSLAFPGSPKEKQILKNLSGADIVAASSICKTKLGSEVVSGIYLLGYAVSKKIIPLEKESILKAIGKVIPDKYLELNRKAFLLAYD